MELTARSRVPAAAPWSTSAPRNTGRWTGPTAPLPLVPRGSSPATGALRSGPKRRPRLDRCWRDDQNRCGAFTIAPMRSGCPSAANWAFVDWPHAVRAVDAATGSVRTLAEFNVWHAAPKRFAAHRGFEASVAYQGHTLGVLQGTRRRPRLSAVASTSANAGLLTAATSDRQARQLVDEGCGRPRRVPARPWAERRPPPDGATARPPRRRSLTRVKREPSPDAASVPQRRVLPWYCRRWSVPIACGRRGPQRILRTAGGTLEAPPDRVTVVSAHHARHEHPSTDQARLLSRRRRIVTLSPLGEFWQDYWSHHRRRYPEDVIKEGWADSNVRHPTADDTLSLSLYLMQDPP